MRTLLGVIILIPVLRFASLVHLIEDTMAGNTTEFVRLLDSQATSVTMTDPASKEGDAHALFKHIHLKMPKLE